jgi:hypothetical protein
MHQLNDQPIKKIVTLNNNCINIVIKTLNNSFKELLKDAHSGFPIIDRHDVNLRNCLEDTTTSFINSQLVGIDIPVLLKSNKSKGDIAIVGLDPLRSKRDFATKGNKNTIIWGTPFGIHSSYYKEKRTEVYVTLINHILNRNYSVYLTDLYKMYIFLGKNKLRYKRNEKDYFHKILSDELIKLEITNVFALGCETYNEMMNHNSNGLNITKLEHPSGRNMNWNNLICPNNKVMKKKYLIKNIDCGLESFKR